MKRDKMKIILDCEAMRHPDSGQYNYCRNLGLSVEKLLLKEDAGSISFYVPPQEADAFGPHSRVIVEKKSFWNFFRPFPKGCDVWHSPLQSGRALPEKRRHSSVKVLLTIHDLLQLYDGRQVDEQQKSIAQTQMQINKSDGIVCISEFCKKDVLRHCDVNGKSVWVIHNGSHRVHPPKLNGTSYKPLRPFLFGIGQVNARNNYHVLLPLLMNESIELVIAGRLTEPDYVNQMKKQANAMGVADRLHLLGPITEGEKGWYFAHCLAFVHPSLAECSGAPVVEAMQFGKPLFLSNLTSLPEIAGDTAFYFNSFEGEQVRQVFYEGMIRHEKEHLGLQIKRKGTEFDWTEKAKEYLRVYRALSEKK